MLLTMLLAACSENSSNDGVDEPQDNSLHISSVTRAVSRLDPTPNSTIKMFVMTKDDQYSTGEFTYSTDWQNNGVSVKEHEQYYMYGFMPAGIATSSSAAKPAGGDYSQGADLTLTGLPIFTDEDICVVVGVRKIASNTDYTEATMGSYGYLSGLNSENYVNLLMDHLYSQLILQFNVDADYNALRHIKLKTVTLTSTYGEKVNATIKFRAGNSLDINSVAYSKNTDAGSGNSNVLEILKSTETAKFLTKTATEVSFGPFNCAPCTFDADGTNLTLTCTYDVYNTAENKVLRAGCTATNKLKVASILPGVRKTVTLTIAPTYLYVLSDDDLNNPTIVVNSE